MPELPKRTVDEQTGRPKELRRALTDRLEEAAGLARAIQLNLARTEIVKIATVRPATLFGTGKVAEIGEWVADDKIQLVVVDHALTPVQQRNLERAWNTKVLDRTGLILEIFGRRARTREGRLQVELAHLNFQRSRLVRSWTHLERQRGGMGFLGGPGETQIETDRRLLRERIEKIQSELEKVVKTRTLHREGRRKVPYPVVAIVGYTNAGKSTLFNRLTGADVLSQDQVFATLDPTMRELLLPSGRRAILSDTVGFISDLPTMLVAAFRATLEEVVSADLILHVRDIAHAETEAQRLDVEDVLETLLDRSGETPMSQQPVFEVWNKIDCLSAEQLTEAVAEERRQIKRGHPPVLVSAVTGEGCDLLLDQIDAHLGVDDIIVSVRLPPEFGKLTSWLHENANVISSNVDENGIAKLRVQISRARHGQLIYRLEKEGLSADHTA